MSKQQQHWEKTRGLLFMTLAIWFVFSIGIFSVMAFYLESTFLHSVRASCGRSGLKAAV